MVFAVSLALTFSIQELRRG